jgi:hypothetical protein
MQDADGRFRGATVDAEAAAALLGAMYSPAVSREDERGLDKETRLVEHLDRAQRLNLKLGQYVLRDDPETAQRVRELAASLAWSLAYIIDHVHEEQGLPRLSAEQRWAGIIRRSEDKLAKIREIAK